MNNTQTTISLLVMLAMALVSIADPNPINSKAPQAGAGGENGHQAISAILDSNTNEEVLLPDALQPEIVKRNAQPKWPRDFPPWLKYGLNKREEQAISDPLLSRENEELKQEETLDSGMDLEVKFLNNGDRQPSRLVPLTKVKRSVNVATRPASEEVLEQSDAESTRSKLLSSKEKRARKLMGLGLAKKSASVATALSLNTPISEDEEESVEAPEEYEYKQAKNEHAIEVNAGKSRNEKRARKLNGLGLAKKALHSYEEPDAPEKQPEEGERFVILGKPANEKRGRKLLGFGMAKKSVAKISPTSEEEGQGEKQQKEGAEFFESLEAADKGRMKTEKRARKLMGFGMARRSVSSHHEEADENFAQMSKLIAELKAFLASNEVAAEGKRPMATKHRSELDLRSPASFFDKRSVQDEATGPTLLKDLESADASEEDYLQGFANSLSKLSHESRPHHG